MTASNDSPNGSAALNPRAMAFIGAIAGMLLAIVFGLGTANPEYDSQEYWALFEQQCAPGICHSPVFETHRATLHLMAIDATAVDPNAKRRMLAAIRCAYDLQRREYLIVTGGLDESDAVIQKLSRERSDSCREADLR